MQINDRLQLGARRPCHPSPTVNNVAVTDDRSALVFARAEPAQEQIPRVGRVGVEQ